MDFSKSFEKTATRDFGTLNPNVVLAECSGKRRSVSLRSIGGLSRYVMEGRPSNKSISYLSTNHLPNSFIEIQFTSCTFSHFQSPELSPHSNPLWNLCNIAIRTLCSQSLYSPFLYPLSTIYSLSLCLYLVSIPESNLGGP